METTSGQGWIKQPVDSEGLNNQWTGRD